MVRWNTTQTRPSRLVEKETELRKRQISKEWSTQERVARLRIGKARRAWFLNFMCRQSS